MKYARIIGTGSYLPQKVITNADLEASLDTSDAWITERTGIQQRHMVNQDDTAASMGAIAAQNALQMANFDASAIDLIIVATCTPDKIFPSTACLIQDRLDNHTAFAFDISAACSGFIYAIGIANQFIQSQSVKTALVVGSEAMSRIVNWQDRKTCILFGDGAGAVLLQADDKPGIHSVQLYSDGQYKDLLYVPSSIASQRQESELPFMYMNGNAVFKIAVNTLEKMVDDVLRINHIQQADIDWLVPHQANSRIIHATAKKLGLPLERVIITLDKQGNTSAASIPLALDQAIRDGRIKKGERLLLEAFGGGMAWGAAFITY